jgi:hypothetical protein
MELVIRASPEQAVQVTSIQRLEQVVQADDPDFLILMILQVTHIYLAGEAILEEVPPEDGPITTLVVQGVAI